MDENQETSEYSLNKLRVLFRDTYFNTSKILIASEQYSGVSNVPLFYYLGGIFDRIYVINNSKENDKIDKEISRMKTAFIGLQDYILNPSIGVIAENLDDKTSVNRIIKSLQKKLKKIGFITEYQWKLFDLSDVQIDTILDANHFLLDSFSELLKLLSIDFKLDDEKWGYYVYTNECPIESMKYKQKFSELMMNYDLCRIILYDVFRRRGTYYECAITDIRDALDHFAKSLFMNEEKATEELVCAKEHIRRATVETLQDYVLEKFNQKCESLKYEPIKKKQLYIFEISQVKEKISFARYTKSNKTWEKSVLLFYNALEAIQKIGRR